MIGADNFFGGIIYKYTSPKNKVYIGKTTKENTRISQHKWASKISPKSYFHKAINKYGFENFKYEVIFRISSKNKETLNDLLNEMEKYFIRKYQSNNAKYGYNLTEGGEGLFMPSDSVIEKMREKRKSYVFSNETKKRIHLH